MAAVTDIVEARVSRKSFQPVFRAVAADDTVAKCADVAGNKGYEKFLSQAARMHQDKARVALPAEGLYWPSHRPAACTMPRQAPQWEGLRACRRN